MKARFHHTALKAVLSYQLAEREEQALNEILAAMRIPVLSVRLGQEHKRVAQLLEIAAGKAAPSPDEKAAAPDEPLDEPAPAFAEPCLVIAGLAGEEIDLFLAALRDKQIAVSLKAVATPHNLAWRFADLYRELRRERDAFAAQKAAERDEA